MNLLHPHLQSVTAFAPATCANAAVGFDILGFALEGTGDYVTLTKRQDNQLIIETIESREALPLDIDKNTASVVIKKLCADQKIECGFSMSIKKGIALGSGMGGSAASAIAALTAINAFLIKPLTLIELAQYALLGEEVACGQQHADNVVPCLFGGFTLIQSLNPIAVVSLPVPNLFCTLIHPHLRVDTEQARTILKHEIALHDYVKQSANLASFIASLYREDHELLQKSMIDLIIEPQRACLVPEFYQVKNNALAAGALAVSFSGSGPSLFALAKTKNAAEQIADVMYDSFKRINIHCDSWISPIGAVGARVVQQRGDNS